MRSFTSLILTCLQTTKAGNPIRRAAKENEKDIVDVGTLIIRTTQAEVERKTEKSQALGMIMRGVRKDPEGRMSDGDTDLVVNLTKTTSSVLLDDIVVKMAIDHEHLATTMGLDLGHLEAIKRLDLEEPEVRTRDENVQDHHRAALKHIVTTNRITLAPGLLRGRQEETADFRPIALEALAADIEHGPRMSRPPTTSAKRSEQIDGPERKGRSVNASRPSLGIIKSRGITATESEMSGRKGIIMARARAGSRRLSQRGDTAVPVATVPPAELDTMK